jgi:hypothetical protein
MKPDTKCRDDEARGVCQQRNWSREQLDEDARNRGAGDLGYGKADQVPTVGLDQVLLAHQRGEHDGNRQSGHQSAGACEEGHHIEKLEPQHAGKGHDGDRTHDERAEQVRDDAHRAARQAVNPGASDEAEQHHWGDAGSGQHARFRRTGSEQQHGRQRQGQDGDLAAE